MRYKTGKQLCYADYSCIDGKLRLLSGPGYMSDLSARLYYALDDFFDWQIYCTISELIRERQ